MGWAKTKTPEPATVYGCIQRGVSDGPAEGCGSLVLGRSQADEDQCEEMEGTEFVLSPLLLGS